MKARNLGRRFVLVDSAHPQLEDGYTDVEIVQLLGTRYHRLVLTDAGNSDFWGRAACNAEYSFAIAQRVAEKVLKPCGRCWPGS